MFFVVIRILQIGAEVNEFDFVGQLLLIKSQMAQILKRTEEMKTRKRFASTELKVLFDLFKQKEEETGTDGAIEHFEQGID